MSISRELREQLIAEFGEPMTRLAEQVADKHALEQAVDALSHLERTVLDVQGSVLIVRTDHTTISVTVGHGTSIHVLRSGSDAAELLESVCDALNDAGLMSP